MGRDPFTGRLAVLPALRDPLTGAYVDPATLGGGAFDTYTASFTSDDATNTKKDVPVDRGGKVTRIAMYSGLSAARGTIDVLNGASVAAAATIVGVVPGLAGETVHVYEGESLAALGMANGGAVAAGSFLVFQKGAMSQGDVLKMTVTVTP